MLIHGYVGHVKMGGQIVARLTAWTYDRQDDKWTVKGTATDVSALWLSYPARKDLVLVARGKDHTWRNVGVAIEGDAITITGEGEDEV